MSKHLLFDPRAQRGFRSLPVVDQDRVMTRLKRLLIDPVPSDAKFIGRHEGERVFRYRIGPYRALYKIKPDAIFVVDIGRRDRVY